MKHKFLIYCIASITFLSAFTGIAASLAPTVQPAETGPALGTQQFSYDDAPILIAEGTDKTDKTDKTDETGKGRDLQTNGNSWGG